MKDGKRVVRIPYPKNGLTAEQARQRHFLFPASTPLQPRRNERRTDERRSGKCVANPPAAPVTPPRQVIPSTLVSSPSELVTPGRPVTHSTPFTPVKPAAHSPLFTPVKPATHFPRQPVTHFPRQPVTHFPRQPVTHSPRFTPVQPVTPVKPVTPFNNPDLNDRPLRWSPRMFKPEVDRYNFSWSDWDSPSREFIDTSYQTVDSPRDEFTHLPLPMRRRIREILAMKPEPLSSAHSSDSLMVDTVRYEPVKTVSKFSSDTSTHSTNSDFSSWVDLDVHPWTPALLEMYIDCEKDRQWCEDRGIGRRDYLSEGLSTLSFESESSDSSTHSTPSEDGDDEDFSSWVYLDVYPWTPELLEMYIDGEKERQWFEDRGIGKHNYSSEDLSTLSSESPDSSTHSTPSEDGDDEDLSSWVYLDVHPWPQDVLEMYIDGEKERQWFQERGIGEHDLSSDSDISHSNSFLVYAAMIGASTHSNSPSPSPSPPPRPVPAVRNHFESLQQRPSAIPPPPPPPQQQHFQCQRQVPTFVGGPSRLGAEPKSNSGWKSLAVGFAAGVAVATVTAGLAVSRIALFYYCSTVESLAPAVGQVIHNANCRCHSMLGSPVRRWSARFLRQPLSTRLSFLQGPTFFSSG
ncbi:hypothetical protein F4779DRAFT_577518 [Xylariaceae sp. FL0662B]|nr:hypothetical protein F4779DRAFT_577518 [Xylariaceae sp. FL0662B]